MTKFLCNEKEQILSQIFLKCLEFQGKTKVREIFCEFLIALLIYWWFTLTELDISDIYRESLKVHKKYKACLTTIIYDDTNLDPEKFKARSFDPIK